MGKSKIDRKSERIVKGKGRRADIIKANPTQDTLKVRTVDKHGNKSARTFSLTTKHGLSPKREDRKPKSKPKKKK